MSLGLFSLSSTNLSMWSLFWQADIVVKLIILGLIGASIWCWSIMFEKFRTLKTLNKQADMFEEKFWSGRPLKKLYNDMNSNPSEPMETVFYMAMHELQRAEARGSAADDAGTQNLKMRLERVMNVTIDREIDDISKFMTVLATTASTAPFIGLFGTVWGIMNSFAKISAEGSASLLTVAGPISEALFATAVGLFAAIPAVMAYNKINQDISRYTVRLDSFANEFLAAISRNLSEKKSTNKVNVNRQTYNQPAQEQYRQAEPYNDFNNDYDSYE